VLGTACTFGGLIGTGVERIGAGQVDLIGYIRDVDVPNLLVGR
jgi:hypothetical protein